jgi:hypothetical protein
MLTLPVDLSEAFSFLDLFTGEYQFYSRATTGRTLSVSAKEWNSTTAFVVTQSSRSLMRSMPGISEAVKPSWNRRHTASLVGASLRTQSQFGTTGLMTRTISLAITAMVG